jgi:hypothetical protein
VDVQASGSGRPDDRGDPEIAPIEPVIPGARPPRLPRVVVVAVVVGVLAFVAGARLGPGPAPVEPSPTASPVGPSATSSASPAPTEPPVSAGQETSEFVRTFRPQEAIAGIPGSAGCTTRVWSVAGFPVPRPSPTLVRVWMADCPIDAARRAQFFTDLTIVLERQIPFGTMSSSADLRGMTVAYYPYTTGPFVGQVTGAAAPAGRGLGVTITLEERRAP